MIFWMHFAIAASMGAVWAIVAQLVYGKPALSIAVFLVIGAFCQWVLAICAASAAGENK